MRQYHQVLYSQDDDIEEPKEFSRKIKRKSSKNIRKKFKKKKIPSTKVIYSCEDLLKF